ncbi:MAG: hypothetical protein IJA80_08050 [Clostridia bacterium]|nr:hypothetical protein [Clostridia bacterium]
MVLFDLFKKKEPMTDEQLKLEYLWEKWRLEEVPEPYNTLMTYYKEIKKEGHTRFFLNIAFCGEVEKAVNKIGDLLPPILCENLKTAYSHYVVLVNEENEETEQKIRECDTFFDENEQLLLDMIQEYADTLEV